MLAAPGDFLLRLGAFLLRVMPRRQAPPPSSGASLYNATPPGRAPPLAPPGSFLPGVLPVLGPGPGVCTCLLPPAPRHQRASFSRPFFAVGRAYAHRSCDAQDVLSGQ